MAPLFFVQDFREKSFIYKRIMKRWYDCRGRFLPFHAVHAFDLADDVKSFKMLKHFVHACFAGIVGDDNDFRFRVQFVRLLDHGLQADAELREYLGDFR